MPPDPASPMLTRESHSYVSLPGRVVGGFPATLDDQRRPSDIVGSRWRCAAVFKYFFGFADSDDTTRS